jgi:hypothetical protein
MKKVCFVSNQDFDVTQLEVNHEDGPVLRLFEFKGFAPRVVDSIVVSKCNAPRKTEYTHGNVDALEASLSGGWAVKLWPLCIFRSSDGEEVLFDRRHTLRAMKNLGIYSAPVAIYERVLTGNRLLDSLSDETAQGLMGLFINATEMGNTNAVNSDFIRMLIATCEDESIPLTHKNVKLLMDVAGVNIRYNHTATITGIYNAVTKKTGSSTRVFNTTKEEIREYVSTNNLFGTNNYSSEDGVAVRTKVMDHQFNYRYAGDILKWYFESEDGLRVSLASKAEDENRIEGDRREIISLIEEIYVNSATHYAGRLKDKFGSFINMPTPSLDDLIDLELWAIPQIEGETEAIQLF